MDIPKPKYMIGDIVLTKSQWNSEITIQFHIDRAFYLEIHKVWIYQDGYRECREEDVIMKIN